MTDQHTESAELDHHIYLGGPTLGRKSFQRNLLPFLERHNFSVVVNDYSVTPETAGGGEIRDSLRELRDRDIDVWLGTGALPGGEGASHDDISWTDQELFADEEKLETFLDAHREVARTYQEFFPGGKLILWHEEPIMGNWTGETRAERAESVVKYGPSLFAEQKNAVKDISTDLDVGFFPHDVVMADSDHSESPICDRLLPRMEDQGALPDFTYIDSYRGYRERLASYRATNDFLDNIFSNLKKYMHSRPIYYLGEAHTINNHYTPSRQSILGNLRTALDNDIDGYGWYFRGNYRSTGDWCYNPYLPNVGDVDDEEKFNSLTGSRDRMLWANMLLLEQLADFDPADRFDLWMYGYDFDFYEHELSLQTTNGEWEFIGDFSGYVDGDTPYAGGGRTKAVAFHALERDRYLGDDGTLHARIRGGGDGGRLDDVYVMPYFESGLYQTEEEITSLIRNRDLSSYALGTWSGERSITPKEETTVAAETRGTGRSPVELLHSNRSESYEQMATFEAHAGTDIRDYADLWLLGNDLANVTVRLGGEPIDEHTADAGDGGTSDGGAVVLRGISRSSRFTGHGDSQHADLSVEGDGGDLLGAYLMPAGGASSFVSAENAAQILTEEYRGWGQVENFCLACQTFPNGRSLEDRRVDTRLHVGNDRAVGGYGGQ